MNDPETAKPADEEQKLPRTVHKSDPEEKPDPEEDEDQTTARPTKV